MVIVTPIHRLEMQRRPARLRETHQPMLQHLGRQVADILPPEAEIDDGEGTRGDVHDGPRQGFVERGVAPAEADERAARAEGAREGGAERQEDVFARVVVVDVEVAVGAEREGPAGVFG